MLRIICGDFMPFWRSKNMNEKSVSIAINYDDDRPTVSGRDLHRALQIKIPYMLWFERMKEYGFEDPQDYNTVLKNVIRSDGTEMPQKFYDHQISISMALRLCEVQKTELGRKFREYFSSIEEAWNSPEKIMERALKFANKQALKNKQRIRFLEDKIDELEVSLNRVLQYYTVEKFNKTFHEKWNLEQRRNIEKNMAYHCRTHAIQIRTCETNDERFGRVNSYPLSAWNDYLGMWE